MRANDQLSYLPGEAITVEIIEETMMIESMTGNVGDDDAMDNHISFIFSLGNVVRLSRDFLGRFVSPECLLPDLEWSMAITVEWHRQNEILLRLVWAVTSKVI